jgi:hypothetical protein
MPQENASSPRAQALGDELISIHERLRKELATLMAGVEDFTAGRPFASDVPAPGLGSQLRGRCLWVCEAIHAHHTTETTRGFPLLEQRFPDLAPAVDLLRREHDILAGLRRQLEETLAGLGTGDTAKVHTELRHLTAEMEAHFDREERQLVAALNAL